MQVNVGTVDNFEILPTPVLDESAPEGYRMEQRLQVSLKSAADERQLTVEFRLGEGSDAPSEQQLNAWLEAGELVQAFCTGLAARPFVHRDGKTYRTRGKEVQIGDTKAALDAFVVFAGFAMSPLGEGALTDRGGSAQGERRLQTRPACLPRAPLRRALEAAGSGDARAHQATPGAQSRSGCGKAGSGG